MNVECWYCLGLSRSPDAGRMRWQSLLYSAHAFVDAGRIEGTRLEVKKAPRVCARIGGY